MFLQPRNTFAFRRAVLLSFLACAGTLQAGDFSLDQVMSAPFPAEMTAAPVGGHVAWVANHKGARNIWAASPPEYRGRKITGWEEDDGTTISRLSWTRDGNTLVFVRGDGANSRGEFPNPLQQVGGTEQAIWVVSLAGGDARRLAEGSSPAVSPTGEGFAYVSKNRIWWRAFEADAKPEEMVQARGSLSRLRWSPDGSRLALVSERGDHSFVGIFDKGDKTLRFLDPSLDRDSQPVWSPDGKRIAFLRIPASRDRRIFAPERSSLPWSLRIVDLAGGTRGREIWRADAGPGSAFREIVAADQILWSADGFIVFPWEKDGWTHLYSVPAAGGAARLLTPGNFEVEAVQPDFSGRAIIYSSNQDDIDRRHLWRVEARGGSPQALTGGTGNQWSPTPTSDPETIAYIGATGTRPAQPHILREGGSRALSPLPAGFPTAELVEPQPILFQAADGMPIHGQLFLPRNHRAGEKRPAMLYFHGGSRRQMLLGFHYSSYYHNCYAMNQYLAARGYVVLSVNYRSGIGYGMQFREALNYGARGASEFNDVLGAGLYLRGRDDVDGRRIGLWGGSYGGYLTALGLARASDLFAAGVDLHGVHDWNVVIKNFVPSYDPVERAEAARLALQSSPMSSIDTWRSPVLLIHGDDDRNVPFSESVDLAEALRKKGDVEFEQLVFPDEVHGFLLHRSWLKAFEAAAEFLDRRLAPPR